MAFLGAPDTCPDEDYCVINNTTQLDRYRADWEATALIEWALEEGAATDDKDNRRRFGLRCSEVAVTHHHPEEYLIRFECKSHRDRVYVAQKFHHDGLAIHGTVWFVTLESYTKFLQCQNRDSAKTRAKK